MVSVAEGTACCRLDADGALSSQKLPDPALITWPITTEEMGHGILSI